VRDWRFVVQTVAASAEKLATSIAEIGRWVAGIDQDHGTRREI
jgi:hypothetical protein